MKFFIDQLLFVVVLCFIILLLFALCAFGHLLPFFGAGWDTNKVVGDAMLAKHLITSAPPAGEHSQVRGTLLERLHGTLLELLQLQLYLS